MIAPRVMALCTYVVKSDKKQKSASVLSATVRRMHVQQPKEKRKQGRFAHSRTLICHHIAHEIEIAML